ncbi:MAG: endonuclease [Paludibacteraceae bacterium]|nr:endonuclease [Paludibacteraceae bacterium]
MKIFRHIAVIAAIGLFISAGLFAGVPSGYYYLGKNKTKAELKTTLSEISGPLRVLYYGSGPGFTWEGFFSTDRNTDSTIIDMYSTQVRHFNGFGSVDGMHIEHSLPKSWWGAHENDAYKDLYHLYPADGATNSLKNNLPLGEVAGVPSFDNGVTKIGKNGFGNIYTESCFEPADEYKGDFARSYFYISTIYQDFENLWNSPMMQNNTYPVWTSWAKDLLLKWHRQDPVSAKELARIEAVYNIQGNRNPFIDYPELAEYIWGADTTKVFPFPDETEAFLLHPRRGESINFGVVLQTGSRTHQLQLNGVNISSDIVLSFKNNVPGLSLTKTNYTLAEVITGTNASIIFNPQSSGYLRDTLLISGGGLTETIEIPLKAFASEEFLALEPTDVTSAGAQLQWISDPEATGYNIEIYEGDKQAGDLIISAYVEGSSWNKAIALYNGTGQTVDLSKYYLRKQSNGDGYFGSTLRLSGDLHDKSTYLIVHKSATLAELTNNATLLTDTLLQFNGNDAIELVRAGVTIDMVGEANAGADIYWGQDISLQRKSSVTHPHSVYRPSEWNSYPIDIMQFVNTHEMNLQETDPQTHEQKTLGQASGYHVEGLKPASSYTYSVEAIRPDGNVKAKNTVQIHTADPEIPLIMEAYNITHNGFTASWEENLYSDHYLLDVFRLSGSGNTVINESFDNVESNGKPLPEGWTGTASGNYTSTTSSGIAIPSVGLKNNDEWLQTAVYPQPVTKLSFMYRYPSSGTGSYFILEAHNKNIWNVLDTIAYVNTSKNNPEYNFTSEQNYRSFRISYKKSSGNLAIDDVMVQYGSYDTVFVLKNKIVSSYAYEVNELNENTDYLFRVRGVQSGINSDYSDIMAVTTVVNTATKAENSRTIKYSIQNGMLNINGLSGTETIRIYNTTGACINNRKTTQHTEEFYLPANGIYLLQIRTDKGYLSFKVIR